MRVISRQQVVMQKEIYFAVDYLSRNTKSLWIPILRITNYFRKGKKCCDHRGGDTGNDCVGTAIRQGAKVCNPAGDDAMSTGRAGSK